MSRLTLDSLQYSRKRLLATISTADQGQGLPPLQHSSLLLSEGYVLS